MVRIWIWNPIIPNPHLVVPDTSDQKSKIPFYRCAQSSVGYAEPGPEGPAFQYEFTEHGGDVKLSGRSFDIFHGDYGGNEMQNAGIEKLNRSLLNVKNNANGRILIFTNIDFSGIDNPAWTKTAVEQLEKDVKAGAAGLKVYKDLGLEVKDKNGKRITVDDPAWIRSGKNVVN